MDNEIWRLTPGQLAAYTDDPAIRRKIRRYYSQWPVMAEYYTSDGKLHGLQYRMPTRDSRKARRVFGVKITEE